MKRIEFWFIGLKAGWYEPHDVQTWWYSMADNITIAYYDGYKLGTALRRTFGPR